MAAKLISRIRIPLLLALMNGLAWAFIGPSIPDTVAAMLFNGIRLVLIYWAAALALPDEESGLLPSAFAGALVFAADHLLVTGAHFLLTGAFAAALGVLVSFLMFVWIAMLLGALAGLIQRKATPNTSKQRT